jgi:hypothetical protein
MVHQQDFLREGLGGESGTVDDACTPMRCQKKSFAELKNACSLGKAFPLLL